MAEQVSTKVVTGKVRFSYANVFEAKAVNEGDEAKYSVAVLIPKKDKATVAKVEAAVNAAIEQGKSKWGGKVPLNLKRPLRDGDTEREGEEYKGMYFINCTSKNKPGIVDAELNPILSREEFYSGCYGRASINFYAFDFKGNRGVAAGLNNLQKLEDGERLSGGATAADDFGSADDLLG